MQFSSLLCLWSKHNVDACIVYEIKNANEKNDNRAKKENKKSSKRLYVLRQPHEQRSQAPFLKIM